ncbi:MAG: hypothetical protein ACR2JH_05100 [Solirubrobacteraceae bacterium]
MTATVPELEAPGPPDPLELGAGAGACETTGAGATVGATTAGADDTDVAAGLIGCG